jgi:hypothetical protein
MLTIPERRLGERRLIASYVRVTAHTSWRRTAEMARLRGAGSWLYGPTVRVTAALIEPSVTYRRTSAMNALNAGSI